MLYTDIVKLSVCQRDKFQFRTDGIRFRRAESSIRVLFHYSGDILYNRYIKMNC